MIGAILALLASSSYSLSAVLIRKRIGKSNPLSVALVVTVTGSVILWPLALLFTDFKTINVEGILFFAMAGILSPGIARQAYYGGMKVVGVSVTSAISATSPMYTAIFGVLLLSETLTLENWIGIICIVVCVVLIERSLSKPNTEPERTCRAYKDLVLPLVAALTIAFGLILRKYGLNICDEPLLGAATGYSSSLLLCLLLSVYSQTTRGTGFSGEDFRLFWKAGTCASMGWFLAFCALSFGKVSIVTPLIQTQPLFILFFSYLYLKELEHISFKLIINVVLIAIGIMLVIS